MIEARIRRQATVFGSWKVKERLSRSADGRMAVFRLVHTSTTTAESMLTVISLFSESGDFDSLPEHRKLEIRQIRHQMRLSAEDQINSRDGDYLAHTIQDWSEADRFGFDLLVRTKLPDSLRGSHSTNLPLTSILPNICWQLADTLGISRDTDYSDNTADAPGGNDPGGPGPSRDSGSQKAPKSFSPAKGIAIGCGAVLLLSLLILAAIVAVPIVTMLARSKPSTQLPLPSGTTPPAVVQPVPSVTPTLAPTLAPETSEAEEGLPADHPYYSIYASGVDFILPESDVRYYSAAEIMHLSDLELTVAYHEIAARHGTLPPDTELQAYFLLKDWFRASSGDYALSDYEQGNQILIEVQLMKRDGSIKYAKGKYLSLYNPGDEYFLDSDDRYLTSADLKGLSKDALTIARNEIFARQGYIFGVMDIHAYFCCMDWYVPTYHDWEFSYGMFDEYDSANISLILVYETIWDYKEPSADNPYIPYYYSNGTEYICPDSHRTVLTEEQLMAMDKNQVTLALNEIYARHGLAFEYGHLLQYFKECSWYSIDISPKRADMIKLNPAEEQNVALLKQRLAQLS